MELQGQEFWKKASNTVEFLIKNHVKFQLNDLLEELPEGPSPYKELPRLPQLKLKSSSLDLSYRNYNQKLMDAIERSRRFGKITDERKDVKTPVVLSRTIPLQSYSETKNSFNISGKKAKILMNMPEKEVVQHKNLDLNTRLKEFIGKVHDKYANLVKALEFKGELLNFEAIVEYLKKTSILLKRPTYTRDKQRAYSKSPSSYKRTRIGFSELGYNNSEKLNLLKVTLTQEIFDPFSNGFIQKQHFFGILTMYEYTNYGMGKNLPSSRLDFNNLKHLQVLYNQVTEIKRIYKHYSDGKLLSREGFVNLLKSICTDDQTSEIIQYLSITSKVNLGQFMSVIPLLLENYDNLMVKIQI